MFKQIRLLKVSSRFIRTEAKIVDCPAFVNINQPKTSATFEKYCSKEIPQQVRWMAHGVSRLDFVFATYIADSLKSQTRESRKKGIRIVVRKRAPICKKFQDFMRNDQNKSELFMMLAESLTTMESNFDIAVTNLENVLSNNVNNLDELFTCNHEEADTRIFLHAKNASDNGIRKPSIVTVHPDVVAVALYHFFSLNHDELWREIGVGQNRRYLSIHTYAAVLKEENCRALLF